MNNNYQYIRENINIVDFAIRCGYTVIKKGRYYSLKEHDSVIIDPRRNSYWQNSIPGSGSSIGQGGSVIDFAVNLGGYELSEILKIFSDELDLNNRHRHICKKNNNKLVQKKKDNQLILPEPDDNYKNVLAYLIKTRKIDSKVVQKLIENNNLYQDKHKNCVFVSYDLEEKDKVVFATKRGSNTYKPFFGDVSGSDYSKGWYINNNSSSLFVAESVIDILSIMTLCGDRVEDYNYLAMAGVGKWECIETYLLTGSIKKVIISTDNDKPGKTAANNIINLIKTKYRNIKYTLNIPKNHKDWNEYLKNK